MEVHQAKLTHFLDWQLTLSNETTSFTKNSSAPLSTVGLANAADKTLYLEQYLDSPLEEHLSGLFQRKIERHQIIEIGNMASIKGMGRLMVLTMMKYIEVNHIDYMVFTATPALLTIMYKLGLCPVSLALADPDKLTDTDTNWGHYYDDKPVVVAGKASTALEQLKRCPETRELFNQLPTPPVHIQGVAQNKDALFA